jgi:hypothetical protein
MMPKSAGKSAPSNEWTPATPGATQPPSTSQSSHKHPPKPEDLFKASTKGFLLVDICRGSTKEQMLQAIEKALETHEIPYFTNKGHETQGGAMSGAPPTPQAALKPAAGGAASGWGADDALLMLVRQEGW